MIVKILSLARKDGPPAPQQGSIAARRRDLRRQIISSINYVDRKLPMQQQSLQDAPINLDRLDDYLNRSGAYSGTGLRPRARFADNLLAQDRDGQLKEMCLLAGSITDARIEHEVISWQTAERPGDHEIYVASRRIAATLGTRNCPSITVVHVDEDNIHAHRVTLCMDVTTGKKVTFGGGFSKEAAAAGLAQAEFFGGWRSENNRLFVADATGVYCPRSGIRVADQAGNFSPDEARTAFKARKKALEELELSAESLAIESRTGSWSSERVAKLLARPTLQASKNWGEVHAGLARAGIAYVRKGEGAVLEFGGGQVKASMAYANASLARLTHRFNEDYYSPTSDQLARQFCRPTFKQPPDTAAKAERDRIRQIELDRQHDIEMQFERDWNVVKRSARDAVLEPRDDVSKFQLENERRAARARAAKFELDVLTRWRKKRKKRTLKLVERSEEASAIILPAIPIKSTSEDWRNDARIKGVYRFDKPDEGWSHLSFCGQDVIAVTPNLVTVSAPDFFRNVRDALVIATKKWPAIEVNAPQDVREIYAKIGGTIAANFTDPALAQIAAHAAKHADIINTEFDLWPLRLNTDDDEPKETKKVAAARALSKAAQIRLEREESARLRAAHIGVIRQWEQARAAGKSPQELAAIIDKSFDDREGIRTRNISFLESFNTADSGQIRDNKRSKFNRYKGFVLRQVDKSEVIYQRQMKHAAWENSRGLG